VAGEGTHPGGGGGFDRMRTGPSDLSDQSPQKIQQNVYRHGRRAKLLYCFALEGHAPCAIDDILMKKLQTRGGMCNCKTKTRFESFENNGRDFGVGRLSPGRPARGTPPPSARRRLPFPWAVPRPAATLAAAVKARRPPHRDGGRKRPAGGPR
jgi:hypothetical protein